MDTETIASLMGNDMFMAMLAFCVWIFVRGRREQRLIPRCYGYGGLLGHARKRILANGKTAPGGYCSHECRLNRYQRIALALALRVAMVAALYPFAVIWNAMP
ncbi:hypothetical protein [Andreprevotia sp. IGB-42]|uniref:hypothetical protein n=1 Tax=Andreprevotia sp. IGB-42 TaxID=2497473 RepID=UPI00135A4B01|nr:hypothetical protein [Andreprevotia sp. IGB-42]